MSQIFARGLQASSQSFISHSSSSSVHPTQLNDLSSLHQIHHSHLQNPDSVPVSMSNIYFPSIHDTNLAMHINSYHYHLPENSAVDLNYMLGPNPLLDENTSNDSNASHEHQIRQSDYLPQPLSLSPHQQSPPSPESQPKFSVITSTIAQANGHAQDMLPPLVKPDPNDPSFDADHCSSSQKAGSTTPCLPDPYAADFLRDMLGETKWNIFSARLFERRLSGAKAKSRGGKIKCSSSSPSSERDSKGTATAIDFLIKVEVVKEILRTYVPHPYNPLKSLSHVYESCPSGYVTLTRSTVLSLSGWSNTQFSYWARRAEAISVLSSYDSRLHSVAVILEQRLASDCELDSSPNNPPLETHVTGKGLDLIIDDVKRRTGASQFLRGKHSSLDPFGSTGEENGPDSSLPPLAPVYMPTFQATEYTHSPPPMAPYQRRGRSRKGSQAESLYSQQSSNSGFDDKSSFPEEEFTRHNLLSNTSEPLIHTKLEAEYISLSPTDFRSYPPSPLQTMFVTALGTPNHPRRSSVLKTVANNTPKNRTDTAPREIFPLSDSRSESQNWPQKRPSYDMIEVPPSKRIKQSDALL